MLGSEQGVYLFGGSGLGVVEASGRVAFVDGHELSHEKPQPCQGLTAASRSHTCPLYRQLRDRTRGAQETGA